MISPTGYSLFYDWPPSHKAVRWTVRLSVDSAAELRLRAGCPRAGVVGATTRNEAKEMFQR